MQALAAKKAAFRAAPLHNVRASKGMGPNKACGHKGGMPPGIKARLRRLRAGYRVRRGVGVLESARYSVHDKQGNAHGKQRCMRGDGGV